MEDNQNTSAPQQTETSNQGVSFPSVGQPQKKSGGAKTLLIVGILALVAILGFIIFRNASKNSSEEASPTPIAEIPTPEPVATTVATSTAKPSDKSKVKIQIQNGTGIAGEAAYLQTQLKNLGYTNVTVGNATSQDETTTTVTFAKSLSSEAVDELTKKLKEIYKDVTVKTSTTATMDAVIVTGLRKGATSKPEATTAAASATPKATGTPTATSSN